MRDTRLTTKTVLSDLSFVHAGPKILGGVDAFQKKINALLTLRSGFWEARYTTADRSAEGKAYAVVF